MAELPSVERIFERNIGFISSAEQERLQDASVLILGVGGMGGAALETLLRSGVGRFVIADPDVFETHNLNRQIFCDLDQLGRSKVDATKELALKINPHALIDTYPRLSGDLLARAIEGCDVVINGCDDPRATIELHRACARHGKTVIDALAATLPNVCVFPPGSGGIEKLLGSPTRQTLLEELTPALLAKHSEKEIAFVMIHSSSRLYVDLPALREFLAGKRKRFSFAPMVLTAGNLMAAEAISVILGRGATKREVYFFDPWKRRIERPKRGFGLVFGILAAWKFSKSL